MRVKTKLGLNAFVSVGLGLVVLLTLGYGVLQINDARRTVRVAESIVKGVAELDSITYDYVFHPEERAKEQWELKHESLGKLLSGAPFQEGQVSAVLRRIRSNYEGLKPLFAQLASNQEAKRRSTGISESLLLESRERLVAQFIATTQMMSGDAFLLSRASEGTINSVLWTSLFIVFCSIVLLVAVTGGGSLFLSRAIAHSLRRLQEGTKTIALGDLDYRIAVSGGDELSALADSFNQMTASLKGVTASKTELEREMAERERAQLALRESEQRWATTLASIGDAVIATDVDCRITFMNVVAEELTGWTLHEASQRPVTEVFNIVNEQTRAEVENPVSRVLREGMIVGLANHTILVKKDGTEVPIDDSGAPIRDADGKTMGVVLVFRDITERKRIEEEVRRSRDELELRVQERTQALRRQADLLELAHNAIIVRDMENRITFWNHAAEEMYGWTRNEAKETSIHYLLKTKFPVSRDETMMTLMREGEWEGELEQTTKDGRKITVLSRRALQWDEAGNPAAIMEINLDITAARQAEEHLRQAQKMEAVGTLAGGIAHDFNNMLAVIIGNAELAMDGVPEEMAARHNLDQIFKAGMRARGLVRQILTFSRKTEHERKPIPLTPLVNETFKLLRSSLPTTIGMQLNIDTVADMVLADPVQIQQVLMNLSTNAGDAMRHTGGRLEVSLTDTVFAEGGPLPEAGMQPGTYVTLTVSDTGPGMDENIQSRIFEPFFTTKERGQGTGMGLAVVYGIVQSHQGAITVASQPGQGATFTVYLPRHTSSDKADEPTSRPVPKGKERILFVDDEELLVEMAEGMLERLGYKFVGTTDSTEALQTFTKDPHAFDLVLTDHTMPNMTGAVLAQKLKEIRPDIPVILCTGYSETISKEKAESMGIDGFVMKPLSRNELGEVVRRVLDTKVQA